MLKRIHHAGVGVRNFDGSIVELMERLAQRSSELVKSAEIAGSE